MIFKTELIGNLGRDATVTVFQNKEALNFSVAHTEKWRDKNGVQSEKTTWVNCTIWEPGGLAPYLKKGTLVYLSGTLDAVAYKPKDGGEPKADLRLKVFTCKLLSKAPEVFSTGTNAGAAGKPAPATQTSPASGNPDNWPDPGNGDDMPF